MKLYIFLLSIMVLASIWSVTARSLLKAAVGLAVISIIITIFMFQFNAVLAAVFELSVCTGLITVIFLSTIGLTKPMTDKEIKESSKERIARYAWLPILVLVAGILSIVFINLVIDFKKPILAITEPDPRKVFWNLRHFDLLGQIVILLVGVFGTVLLFKEIELDEW